MTTLDLLAIITTCLLGGLWLMEQRFRMAHSGRELEQTERE